VKRAKSSLSVAITSVRSAGRGLFPLDERWGLTESAYSPEMARQMVWLSGLLTYEQCSQAFERLAHRLIPSASIWRQTQHYGARLEAYQQLEQEHVSVERVMLPSLRQPATKRKGISLDGGMVNIRGEGWKEFKVGTIFEVEQRWERDPDTRELVQVPHGVEMVYTAVLGSASEFMPALWKLAVDQHIPQADDTSITADGAEWIWNLAMDLFPDSLQIVDWFHACQHLAQAAAALFPDEPDPAKRWYAHRLDDLFHGAAASIALELEGAHLSTHALYFRTHQRRMQYQEFREEGYPIGSGTVESGVKQFKARLTGAGMRWSRPNAQRMLILRGAVLDGSFDAYWDTISVPLN
jgi:hypothetical protein